MPTKEYNIWIANKNGFEETFLAKLTDMEVKELSSKLWQLQKDKILADYTINSVYYYTYINTIIKINQWFENENMKVTL